MRPHLDSDPGAEIGLVVHQIGHHGCRVVVVQAVGAEIPDPCGFHRQGQIDVAHDEAGFIVAFTEDQSLGTVDGDP